MMARVSRDKPWWSDGWIGQWVRLRSVQRDGTDRRKRNGIRVSKRKTYGIEYVRNPDKL